MAVGDFNGDGNTDLAVANEGSNLSVSCWDTAMALLRRIFPVEVGSQPYGVVVGDLMRTALLIWR